MLDVVEVVNVLDVRDLIVIFGLALSDLASHVAAARFFTMLGSTSCSKDRPIDKTLADSMSVHRPTSLPLSSMRSWSLAAIALVLLAAGCATNELQPVNPSGDMEADMSPLDMTPPEDMPADGDMGEDMTGEDMTEPEEMGEDMADMLDMGEDMPVDMDMGEDMADMLDMADMPVDMAPCGGMCSEREVCDEGSGTCVDICMQQSAQCGELLPMDAQTPIDCGMCMGGLSCIENVCVDACSEANNTCGEFVWQGADAACATTCTGGQTCFANRCASQGWRQVVSGKKHSCASRSDGTVRCWGDNTSGQLGTLQAGNSSTSPVVLTGLTGIRQMASTDRHTCALDTGDRLWCWGLNDYGQVGDEQPSDARRTPYRHPTVVDVAEVGVGTLHTCVRRRDETVDCVGFNSQGQLGDGSTNLSDQFVDTKNLTSAVQLSVGVAHACAIQRDGMADCWGLNGTMDNFGRLGTGTTPSRTSPTAVVQLAGIRQIASGQDHTCAVTEDGEVWCWGDNTFGQLGDGGSSDTLTPRKANGISNAVAVTAGADHTCAITAMRELYCWGRNDFGQLGLGNRNVQRTPQRVSTLALLLTVDAGFDHTCATTTSGLLYCWGRNDAGQLGQGNTSDSSAPLQIN